MSGCVGAAVSNTALLQYGTNEPVFPEEASQRAPCAVS